MAYTFTRTGAQIEEIHNTVEDPKSNTQFSDDIRTIAGEYRGLWPDTGGSANKGDTYQTQVSGTGTGQYFTALQNTTVDPVGDDVNWRSVVSNKSLGGVTNYQASSVADMIAGKPVSSSVGDAISTGGTTWIRTGSGSTLADFNNITPIDVMDFGLILDTTVDQTTALLDILNQFDGDDTKYFVFGADVLFKPQEVSAGMPTNVILNLSGVRTGFRSDSGSYNNKIGLSQFAKDEPNNDSYAELASGGNVGLHLMNTGVNGAGTSGEKRLASLLYSNRYLDPEQSGRRGYMSHAIVQVGRSPTLTDWHWHIRKLAPWEAASADYFEFWSSGVTTPAGGYCRSDNRVYKTIAGGATGSTPPVHTGGSVSDGGVLWEYIDPGDSTIFAIDENGNVRGGASGNTAALMSLVKRDAGGAIVEFGASGPSNDALLQLKSTDSGGNLVTVPYFRAIASGILRIVNAAGSSLMDFYSDRIVFNKGIVKGEVTDASNSSAISVEGKNSIVVSNPSGTNLSSFTDGAIGQEVTLVFGNGNTTLIHGSGFLLTGSTNVLMGVHDCITLRKFSYTGSWVEVSRSIK